MCFPFTLELLYWGWMQRYSKFVWLCFNMVSFSHFILGRSPFLPPLQSVLACRVPSSPHLAQDICWLAYHCNRIYSHWWTVWLDSLVSGPSSKIWLKPSLEKWPPLFLVNRVPGKEASANLRAEIWRPSLFVALHAVRKVEMVRTVHRTFVSLG